MTAKQYRLAMLGGTLAFAALNPGQANAQLLGSMQLNQSVGADNDYPPHGNLDHVPITDTSIPFSGSISANNGTGCYTTATYNISDNGSVAAITISATGLTTANGNHFQEESTPGLGTTFSLLQPCMYTATIISTGTSSSEFDVYQGNNVEFFLSTSQSHPTATAAGVMVPGPLEFGDAWGMNGFNDAPAPANGSGTYSLTLTFTAIPEPSCAMLLAMPAVLSLRRRRRDGRKPDDGQYCR